MADYVRFGCGGLCAVAIGTYRKLLAGALKRKTSKQLLTKMFVNFF